MHRSKPSLSTRVGLAAYGVAAYAAGLTALVVFILVTYGAVEAPGAGLSSGASLAVNVLLLVFFALQHSVMARRAFKERWTQWIHPSMERATYVLATGLVLLPVLALWQPVGGTAWTVETPALRAVLRAVAATGWAYLFAASFAIQHFELFGLQQLWRHACGLPPSTAPFRERWMYRFDRHPIMTGFLVGMWATPTMTGANLTLAVGFTLYIAIGVYFEERALRRAWGSTYEDYAGRVGTLVPLPGRWFRPRRVAEPAPCEVATETLATSITDV